MSDSRKAAEQAYTVSAFDYPSAPVGSRDWCLFWKGWQAAEKNDVYQETVAWQTARANHAERERDSWKAKAEALIEYMRHQTPPPPPPVLLFKNI